MGHDDLTEGRALDAARRIRGADASHDAARGDIERDDVRLEIRGDERDGPAARGERERADRIDCEGSRCGQCGGEEPASVHVRSTAVREVEVPAVEDDGRG